MNDTDGGAGGCAFSTIEERLEWGGGGVRVEEQSARGRGTPVGGFAMNDRERDSSSEWKKNRPLYQPRGTQVTKKTPHRQSAAATKVC